MRKTKDTIHCRIRYPPSLVIRCNFEDPLLDWPLPQIDRVKFFSLGEVSGGFGEEVGKTHQRKKWKKPWVSLLVNGS